ncbi:TonB-dependent receptor [Congregibacter sp.]|uniref:TonB-dependent receptor n=1 Tax=Congregibacter sp. TaxID=2744308 RepID=UPI00385AE645
MKLLSSVAGSLREPLFTLSPLSAALMLIPLTTVVSVPQAGAQALEEVVVTAQRREVGLQDSALSVSAFTGQQLEDAQVFNAGDLAQTTVGVSFTNPTPFDMELNIRGVMNTRLDAPSASRSVGVFFDEVVVGRMGLMSMDFYDLERVEILRGPQGVLLGKNVVGGAVNIITAKPDLDETSGAIRAQVGNLGAQLLTGHVNVPLTDQLAMRASVQLRQNDGFASNAFTGRDLHNLDSTQARLSFLYQGDNDFEGRLTFEYMEDEGNGTCAIGEGGNPWSVVRDGLGLTDIRKCAPEPVQYSTIPGDSLQFYEREATSLTLRLEKGFENSRLVSITSYRDGDGQSQYSQTGLGPDAPGVLEYIATGGPDTFSYLFAFDFPVREAEDLSQFTQEFRLVSDNPDSASDYIFGVYYQEDEVDKNDLFWGEILLGVPSLNGESDWQNQATTESLAVFGQVGYKFTDDLKFTLGARYTEDETDGQVRGLVRALGDKFNPADTVPLTPLNGEPDGMGGIAFYPLGGGFDTPYGESWSETTLSGILEYSINDDVFLYANVSQGYKAGGFQDTPSNTAGATVPYDPETVLSYELGMKSEFMDRRLRVNAALFMMDYENLQVEFTNDVCLCNIVSNASDAKIQGAEIEIDFAATNDLLVWFKGSFLDTEYENYVISTGDFSGNQLQRTPDNQVNTGMEYTASLGDWGRALKFRLSYTWQDEMPWAHTNVSYEDAYGMLDGRIGLSPEGRNWTLALWGRNITDEEPRANVIEFLGGDVSLYNPPATYGIEAGYRF